MSSRCEGSHPSDDCAAPAPPVLEIRDLRKRYGRTEALRGLDLTVRRGEVYGFLGRNGAGKSTAIRIVMAITRSTTGSVRLFGEPLSPGHIGQRRRIGYVAQEQNFYGWMTAAGIGRFVGGLYPTWDPGEYRRLLDVLDLPSERKIRTFSGGMSAKLGLALALAHRPELLVLDEPTAGLDPVARREFIRIVRDQAEHSQRTTFFSSHLVDEVEAAADRVGIIDQGATLYEGSLAELSSCVRLVTRAHDGIDGEQDPADLPAAMRDESGTFRIVHDRRHENRRELVVRAQDAGLFDRVAHGAWRVERLSLEDILIELVTPTLEATAGGRDPRTAR